MSRIISIKDAQSDTAPAASTANALENLQALVEAEMQGVNQLINESLSAGEASIPDIGAHIVKAGGKRLRPMLTLAAARLCDYDGRNHIALAAAVEMMHTATLLHDDVVDESDLRRGLPSPRMQWGNAASILVGDFMLGQAFKMMVATESLDALDILSSASATIAEGEVMQLAARHDINMSKEDCLKVVDAKTATLFSAATQIGAVIADQDSTTRAALALYGRHLGIAFQLIDDVLDYGGVGDAPSDAGKNIGDDFREGKITVPVALAHAAGDKTQKQFWRRVMVNHDQQENDLAVAIDYLKQHDALGQTVKMAETYGQTAMDALAIFPDSDYRRAMTGIIDFCIRRAF